MNSLPRKARLNNKRGRGQAASAIDVSAPPLTRFVFPVLIFLITMIVFFPALQNGFVNWDDDVNLLTNPHYQGLGWEQLRWMFTTFHMGHYQPLSWMTFGLDYLLWGMNPFGYHLTNLLLHAANAVFFYFVALRLLSLAYSISEASSDLALHVCTGFAALFFAIHPLRVESVAWVTERRDVLSLFFILGSVLSYLKAVTVAEGSSARLQWMAAGVFLYALSLLSKSIGMTLPLILMILDVYPLRRLGGDPAKWFGPLARRIWWEKVPFLLLAIGAAAIAPIAQREAGALIPIAEHGFIARAAQAFFGLTFYLEKTVAPLALSPLYEIPSHFNPWDWPFLLSGVVVLAVSAALIVVRRRWPAGVANWVYYVVVLAPVLGIVQIGPQLVADRYSYLSCLGWSILAGGGLLYLWRRWVERHIGPWVFGFGSGVAAIVVVGLGVLTWQQAQVWHDSESLWRYVLHVNGDSNIAYYNLGLALKTQGRLEEATVNFQQALKINDKDVNAHYNLGLVLVDQGQMDEAITHFRRVVQLDPVYATAHYNLANSLAMRGQLEDATAHYREAIRIHPAYAEAHGNLGNVLAMQGELNKAFPEYREALRIKPDLTNTRFNLALALLKGGLLKEARNEFDQLLKTQPDFVEARYYLGTILVAQGDLGKGTNELKEAVRLQPGFAAAHESLARALAKQGKTDEALRHHQQVLRIMQLQREAGPAK